MAFTMKKITIFIAIIAITACAGSGNIKRDDVRQLKTGMTEKEVTDIVGPPYSVRAKSDGTEVWIWVHVNLMMGTESMSLAMKDGKVVQIPKVPESFK